MTSKLDEDHLIARARQGDRDAFADLYQQYLPMIYAYVRARVFDDGDAEDLTEQVFLRAFQSIARYQPRGFPYSAYLYRIARHQVIDHLRRSRRRPATEALDERVDTSAPSGDRAVIELEDRARLQQALDRLPPAYQEVVRLRLLLSLPTSTAAAWLGRSEGAVRVLLHRAVQALRRELGVPHD